MSARTEILAFSGAAGRIDCAFDYPDGEPIGWALVLHPHPLHGGARDNKVVTTIARACANAGLIVVRPNFRGVGDSEGGFDRAVGETEDMLGLIPQIRQTLPELADAPWVLGGFSFGTAVAAQVYAMLAEQGAAPQALMLMGPAVARFQFRAVELPEDTLVVHGEVDEVVPLAEAMDWARPLKLPVVVIPGASHFFHGKLLSLRNLVAQRLKLALG
ncbi:alpha/beta hydrolase [Bordetella avium]|uniref:Serine aminopeptidase S33 domain-containing protein n=1 Tax=Bordetella avium (strain 197N) TaxID=360910 RepID=Q2L1F4_BORA1|nr:alpha/beta family hydrolase [Bordetella avium]AZY47808.1 alpha/beta hydrolase [Bordetella avium]AZY51179.1 alpha/beta hydrolase [Bordetella avium]RIQ14965.1 alpha/beta hydrolase [Bordetella avium]RIQ41428.1 alpha/beta hydrolase [Bordetella avium]RIQ45782.1 alpha/beta hydrolase [Bordetella avium]